MRHPSCAVITCSKKHDEVEYCFLCRNYPCDRYKSPSEKDSFITYQNVVNDMQQAIDHGIEWYQAQLDEKVSFLEYLLNHYNDGRKKNFYCLAVNLLPLADLHEIREHIRTIDENKPQKEKITQIKSWFDEKAKRKNIDLKLRK